MESTHSKILSFEEFVTKQTGETGPELTPANTEFDQDSTPAPAEMPAMVDAGDDHNLSVNMMGSDETGDDAQAANAEVEIETPADDVDAHTEES